MEHSKEAELQPPPYPGHEPNPTITSGYQPQPGMQPGFPPQHGFQPGPSPQPGMHPGYPPQPGMYPAGYSPQPEMKMGYPPQQPGFQPHVVHVTPNMGMGAGTTTVVSPQPGTTIVTVAGFTPFPMSVTCPNCNSQVMTSTTAESGVMTFILCGALIVLGCWLGCCLIPFCIPECQDIIHTCPSCRYRIGMYRRC